MFPVINLKKESNGDFLSKKNKKEFENNSIRLNLKRGKVLSLIILLLDIVLIFNDIFKFSNLWDISEGLKNLYYLHIALLFILAIYFALLYIKKYYKDENKQLLFARFINYYQYISIITWCILISLNAQLIHYQISAYIISIFCVASIMILKPWESVTIFGLSFIMLIICLFLMSDSFMPLSGSIINLTFVVVLSIVISNFNYSSKLQNFKNKKIIIKKNKKLKEHDKLKSVFLGNLSHELKTPLNLIYSAEQMLRLNNNQEASTTEEDQEKSKNYINIIRQNCYRLMRLIDNLLDITRMDAGEYNLSLRNNDIVTIIENILHLSKDHIESNKLDLIVRSKVKEKVIACDPDAIERIVLNLVSNSIKHTSDGGKIEVEIFEEQGEEHNEVCFSISDTGKGVPYELQETIFNRFEQAGDFFTREKEGSGVGLSLVSYLVEMHNGNIKLESEPEKGSKFIIEFPDNLIENGMNSYTDKNINKKQSSEKIEVEFSDIYS
jgi:signal transduction histidine kinase